ncbi:hypothetical protein A0O34_15295 [Chryseobacterium glaciei]|uniref:Uncharacterized protein n=1 Tax=Chryseobacterium glaciei TaxID=1685010 RepID=A0A172XY16_9FLAO|nr:hypothetical protein [Chryseobacterium glaciei]ANF51786.1 hypothetical protein A0O34_15295 [Chryseobacterium glaciei]
MSVRGSFHFRLTSAGNLLGEYFNNYGNIISSESTNRIDQGSGFVGTFITSWIENGQEAIITNLEIQPTINNNMFTLIWTDLKGKVTFQGKASLLEENIIYGYYSGEQFIQEH